jgi:hypothetical protein
MGVIALIRVTPWRKLAVAAHGLPRPMLEARLALLAERKSLLRQMEQLYSRVEAVNRDLSRIDARRSLYPEAGSVKAMIIAAIQDGHTRQIDIAAFVSQMSGRPTSKQNVANHLRTLRAKGLVVVSAGHHWHLANRSRPVLEVFSKGTKTPRPNSGGAVQPSPAGAGDGGA